MSDSDPKTRQRLGPWPSAPAKMVDDATLETLEEPNWGINMRICALINSEEFNGHRRRWLIPQLHLTRLFLPLWLELVDRTSISRPETLAEASGRVFETEGRGTKCTETPCYTRFVGTITLKVPKREREREKVAGKAESLEAS